MKIFLKSLTAAFVAAVVWWYFAHGVLAAWYEHHPEPRAAVIMAVCPTSQIGILWFLSDDTTDMEWLEPGTVEWDVAEEKWNRIPDKSGSKLVVPCPKSKGQAI